MLVSSSSCASRALGGPHLVEGEVSETPLPISSCLLCICLPICRFELYRGNLTILLAHSQSGRDVLRTLVRDSCSLESLGTCCGGCRAVGRQIRSMAVGLWTGSMGSVERERIRSPIPDLLRIVNCTSIDHQES